MGSTGARGTTSNEYELLVPLAQGGMAEIFIARARGIEGMERYVVLKKILRDHAADPRWVEMFLDEARLAARLHHPNIAQVFDLGRMDDTYFFTMEYVHGEDAHGLAKRTAMAGKRIPIGVAVGIALGAAAGLACAHEATDSAGHPLKIVHRDVSPSNVLVSYDGGVKLVDFGVAKANLRKTKTESGTVKGKISYFSPEQCRGFELDARTDVFSLGIVLWELLTTERLYKRDSDFDEMNAIINEPPPAPSTKVEGIPAELDHVVLRALAKDPDKRYQTAREVLEALEAAAEHASINYAPGVLRRFVVDTVGPRTEPWKTPRAPTAATAIASVPLTGEVGSLRVFTTRTTANPMPSAKRRWILGAGAFIVALVIAGVVTWSSRSNDTRPDASSGDRTIPSAAPPASIDAAMPVAIDATVDSAIDAAPVAVDAAVKPAPADAAKRPPPADAKKKPPAGCTDPVECQF